MGSFDERENKVQAITRYRLVPNNMRFCEATSNWKRHARFGIADQSRNALKWPLTALQPNQRLPVAAYLILISPYDGVLPK